MVTTRVHTIMDTQRGSYHYLQNLPNQDAIGGRKVNCRDGEEIVIIAVADGHGAERHDLSKFGSSFAVKVAVQVLNDIVIEHLQESREDIFIAIATGAPTTIKNKWRDEVIADSVNRGYEVDEMRYGTTLMFCVYLRGDLFVASLGDGNVVVSKPDHTEFLWWDAENIHSCYTDSLCQAQAVSLFKMQIVKHPIHVLMATDGLVNSMQDPEGLSKYMSYFAELIDTQGKDAAQTALVENIQNLNRSSTMIDDISVCIMSFENVAQETKCFHAK